MARQNRNYNFHINLFFYLQLIIAFSALVNGISACKWVCERKCPVIVKNPPVPKPIISNTLKPIQPSTILVPVPYYPNTGNPPQQPTVKQSTYEPRPTVLAAEPFYLAEDVNVIKKLTGDYNGNFVKAIIEILTLRDDDQRLRIANRYKMQYNEDLAVAFERKLSNANPNIKELIATLITPIEEYYAKELYNAAHNPIDQIGYVGYDREAIRVLLRSLNEHQLRKTTVAYKELFMHSLADDMKLILPSWYHDYLEYWNKNRPVDDLTLEDLAKQLNKALISKPVDHHTLIRIVVHRSAFDLGNIKDVYKGLYGKSLLQSIKDALYREDDSDYYLKAYQFLVGM